MEMALFMFICGVMATSLAFAIFKEGDDE